MKMSDGNELTSLTACYIQNAGTGKYLGIESENTEYSAKLSGFENNGGNGIQWLIDKDKDSSLIIKNIHSGKSIAINDFSKVVLQENSDQSNDVWIFVAQKSFFKILNRKNGLVLCMEDANVKFSINPDDDNSLWKIYRVNPDYEVPVPNPCNTGDLIVGAQMCNLWAYDEATRSGGGWERIKPFPEREPVIGWYREGTSVVTDWEIKMAVDCGINFFMPCWYRTKGNIGKPVEEKLEHWMAGLKNARYKDYIKYFLMWENINDISCGVEDEDDLLENVTPFLIEKYFKDPCYLKIDNKPLLSIYGVSAIIDELGGEEKAKISFDKMKQMCINAGFDGLVLMGNFCWGDPKTPHTNMKNIGMEYSISYHWPTFAKGTIPEEPDTYTAEEIINGHHICWEYQNKGAVENIINCSMGWDSAPWGNSVTPKKWRLTPDEFKKLLEDSLTVISGRDKNSLAGKIVMLDNWNEFGEGHYIIPNTQYGFGYLDSVKEVFEKK